jgi:uncharacterized protein
MVLIRRAGLLLLAAALAGFDSAPGSERAVMTNPVVHFEIPVTDMDRAVRFYRAVLGHDLSRQRVDGYDMAFFPRADGKPGASGALAKGDVYVPTKTGVIIYFDVPDIDAALTRATRNGGAMLYPKTSVGDAGYVAEIADSEGNRIGLSAAD